MAGGWSFFKNQRIVTSGANALRVERRRAARDSLVGRQPHRNESQHKEAHRESDVKATRRHGILNAAILWVNGLLLTGVGAFCPTAFMVSHGSQFLRGHESVKSRRIVSDYPYQKCSTVTR